MVVWSALRVGLLQTTTRTFQNAIIKRPMSGGHHTLPFGPSRWQWQKFKDLMHFFIFLGVIPCTLVTMYANIFIGPATLSEIPADYVPKHWEYYRSPITRFIARYMLNNPQQDYEKYLHHIYEEGEKTRMRAIERKIKDKMAERNDYQAYYYRPVIAKYHRLSREAADYLEAIRGD